MQPKLILMFGGIPQSEDGIPQSEDDLLAIAYTWNSDNKHGVTCGICTTDDVNTTIPLDKPDFSSPIRSSWLQPMDNPDKKNQVIGCWCTLDNHPRAHFTENRLIVSDNHNLTHHHARIVDIPDTCVSNVVRGVVYLQSGEYLLVTMSRFILLYKIDPIEDTWTLVDAFLPKFANSMITNMLVCKTSETSAIVMTTGAMNQEDQTTSGSSCVVIELTTFPDGSLYMRDTTKQENAPLLPTSSESFSVGTTASVYIGDISTVVTPTLHPGIFYCVTTQPSVM